MFKRISDSIKSQRGRGYVADVVRVQNNLCVTPSQMLALSEVGSPITSSLPDDMFDDGNSGNNFDIPFEHRRGVDIVDAWEYERDCRGRLIRAKTKDIESYG